MNRTESEGNNQYKYRESNKARMQAQQPHPLRCETCKNPHSLAKIRIHAMPFYCMDEEMPAETPEVTAIRGCASHSSAQHQHIEQVIKELEKQKTMMEEGMQQAVTDCQYYRDDGYVSALEYAIALLQAGGK